MNAALRVVLPVDVVEARLEHIPGIVDRWKELMDYHRELDSLFSRRPDGHLRFGRFVGECIGNPEFIVQAAIAGPTIVGYALAKEERYPPVFERSHHCSLFDLCVAVGRQEQGIGTRLLEAVERWARSRGLDRMELRVSVHNPRGRSFWANRGFEDYLTVSAKDLSD